MDNNNQQLDLGPPPLPAWTDLLLMAGFISAVLAGSALLSLRDVMPALLPDPGEDARGAIARTVEPQPRDLAAEGARIYQDYGCVSCHSLDGAAGIGPSLVGVYQSEQALVDGTTVIADRDYLATSILQPQAQIVAGYESQMPDYGDLLTDADIEALVEYIVSLQ